MKNKIIISITVFLVLVCAYFAFDHFALKEACCLPGSLESKTLVENYIKENISELSPEKEVLGGKFYVISLFFTDDNSGIVSYEDGHVLFDASFDYKISESGIIDINNFNILELI